jgi:hypothetical protein
MVRDFQNLNSLIIAANAPCCKHCHYMLSRLNIAHPAPATNQQGEPILKHSLTAWWNPLTDERFNNSDMEFADNVPGLD